MRADRESKALAAAALESCPIVRLPGQIQVLRLALYLHIQRRECSIPLGSPPLEAIFRKARRNCDGGDKWRRPLLWLDARNRYRGWCGCEYPFEPGHDSVTISLRGARMYGWYVYVRRADGEASILTLFFLSVSRRCVFLLFPCWSGDRFLAILDIISKKRASCGGTLHPACTMVLQ